MKMLLDQMIWAKNTKASQTYIVHHTSLSQVIKRICFKVNKYSANLVRLAHAYYLIIEVTSNDIDYSFLCSMCFSQLQGSTLHSLYEEEEQADVYTPCQCFTPPTQNIVQALEFYGADKLISTSYSDSYVREQWWILLLLLYPSSNDFTAHHYYIKPVIVIFKSFRFISGMCLASSQYRVWRYQALC